MDLFRESAAGQIIRYITRNRVLLYPEEKEGFHFAPLVCISQEFESSEAR
jgi:DHA1 family multidrug resistance protein-like MFS transporter